MPIVRIQHTLQGFSGAPEDRFVNSFIVVTAAPTTGGTGTALLGHLLQFYVSLGTYISQAATGPGSTVQMYDIAEAKPRVPFFEYNEPANPFSTSAGGLPAEVACCLSFEGTQISGLPQARRRGRIYLGPLSTTTLATTTASPYVSRPSQTFIDDVLAAAEALRAGWAGTGVWSIYSALTPSPSTCEIVRFWVDNAWDTQRRRGARATQTTSFAVPAP
jgi:hypothetical protein